MIEPAVRRQQSACSILLGGNSNQVAAAISSDQMAIRSHRRRGVAGTCFKVHA